MKRMIEWLETKLSRSKVPVVADEPSDFESVDDKYTIEVSLGAEVAGWMDNHEPAPDEYVPTVPMLKILDEDSLDDSTEFDPYNSDPKPGDQS